MIIIGGADPHFSVKIVFKGENVQGEGGPYRQFFTDVSKELQGTLPLFTPCPNAVSGTGENRDKWVIAPSASQAQHLAMFEFLGRLMGAAIRTGVLLILDLPSFVWKQLVSQSLTMMDLQLIDQSFAKTAKFISEASKEELDQQDFSFTCALSDGTILPLLPNGDTLKVTLQNREQYLKLVQNARFNECKTQIMAIRRGLNDIIPYRLMDHWTWQDLEWKVCGKPIIDINMLKRHTIYSGVSADAPHIGYFWQTLQELNQTDRRGFLRFVWAQERLPVSDEEFERTKTRMMIKPFLGLSDPNSAFPKADTCFFNVMLPEYSSQKILKERLLFAIYTDSHSMNADEPQEDELATFNTGPIRGRGIPAVREESSDEEEEDEDSSSEN
jgi:hypothetical protein